ncbi:MAG: YidH family protein [Actinomycetes bacterium]
MLPGESSTERTRDHLANERTFLAWLRTALAVIGLGAVLAKLRSGHDAKTTAAVAIVCASGAVILVYGALRYYTVARDLRADRFQPANRSPMVITVGVVIATAVVVSLLLA